MCQMKVGVRIKSEGLTFRCFRQTPFLLFPFPVTLNSLRESAIGALCKMSSGIDSD